VEVKTRRSKNFGFPEESVTPSKQQQIKKIAQGFLVKNNLQDIECRFDVISLSFNDNEKFSIHHIKNAF
ncbi:MAG: YraN family protein, partial [Candidatus Aminicenantaceae bacterium]